MSTTITKSGYIKLLALVLSACLLLCALPMIARPATADNAWNRQPADAFAGGSGSADDPYQIADASQLLLFANTVNRQSNEICAVLTADIDLNPEYNFCTGDSSAPYSGGDNPFVWTAITGSDYAPYAGVFDGAGYTISGMYYYNFNEAGGLFRELSANAVVKNLGIVNSYICASSIGSFAAVSSGTLSNCYSTAMVLCPFQGSGAVVGGLIGMNIGRIENCYYYDSYGYENSVSGGNDITVSYSTGNVINCYYLGTEESDSFIYSSAVSASQFASGEVAYYLNNNSNSGVWRQQLGGAAPDPYPVLRGPYVYQNDTGFMSLDDLGGSAPVKLSYVKAPPYGGDKIYSVAIEWGALEYTYHEQTAGFWNEQLHLYDNKQAAHWSVDEDDGDLIRITNRSNASVSVDISYTATDSGVGGDISDYTRTLESAQGKDHLTLPKTEARLTLSGAPTKTSTQTAIGSVKVAISPTT